MDQVKRELVFGPGPDAVRRLVGYDPADIDDIDEATLEVALLDRWAFLDHDPRIEFPAAAALASMVSRHVLADDPPEAWAAAQRMLARGIDHDEVMVQLTRAVADPVRDVVEHQRPFDMGAYVARLDRLPVATWAEVELALEAVTAADQGIDVDALRDRALDRLGIADDDDVGSDLVEPLVDAVLDDWFTDVDAPVLLLADDRVVLLATLFDDDVVMTTMVDEVRVAVGVLPVAVDLPVFRHRTVTLDGVELDRVSEEGDDLAWVMPAGWLAPLLGRTVAVRVDVDGELSIEALDDVPALDDAFVAQVRDAYDALVDDGHPTGVLDVAAELALRHPGVFDVVRAPLGDALDAAGLECRGGLVAHDDEQWAAAELTAGLIDDMFALEGDEARQAAVRLRLALADPVSRGPEWLVEVLEALEACPTTSLVAMRVLTPDGVAADGADELCEALLAGARRPAHQARVRWLAALVAEANGDLAGAEGHLEAGLRADRQATDVVDRLAWYRSDRGDAAGALRLWRSIGRTPGDDHEVHVVAQAAATGDGGGVKLGRNDPCWCGSGRKYKQCHLGQVAQPALPDRLQWLVAKAEGHVRRGGLDGVGEVMDLAAVLAGADADDPHVLVEAMGHPLVASLVLEHGGLARFLAVRGPLLPDDEQLLATSWLATARSVHEVEEVRSGDGVVLRDLRTGDRHDVRDVAFSGQARPGQLILAWVVPDGERHQLLPGAVFVDPSSIEALLALLDDGDAEGLVAWLHARSRPPRLATRDGEPLVACTAELDVDGIDPADVRAALDGRFRSDAAAGGDPDVWHDLVGDDDAPSIRATLVLDETEGILEVQTLSEARLDRALAALAELLPEATVLSDERQALGFDDDGGPGGLRLGGGGDLGGRAGGGLSLPPSADDRGSGGLAGSALADDPEGRAMLEEVLASMEERWCDESVPALGGMTPRAAAADPVQRELLVRLIASFPEPDPNDPMMGFRPARLRELLGLHG